MSDPQRSRPSAINTEAAEDPAGSTIKASLDANLMIASDLMAYGCPVFAAAANPRYGINGDVREYLLPQGWQNTPTANVPKLSEGGALCLGTGHGFDVMDVDVKNGADVEQVRAALIECGVVILGESQTPSRGAHFLVRSTGICSSSKPVNGVDFRGGATDGSGRGFVYLPGTSRPAYAGAGYLWVTKPDTDTAAELDVNEQRDALWTFLQGRGIEPRLTATPPAELTAGEPVGVDGLPERLRDCLSEVPRVGNRSERFFYAVALCKENGYTQGQAVTLLTPWCEAAGKFVGRIAAEVARTWPKIDDPQDLSWVGEPSAPVAERPEVRPADDAQPDGVRHVSLTSAASIKPRRVRWLWLERMALGALSLVAGPEGLGKSTLVYWLVAFVTRGLLPGEHFGTPKSVLIAATEDSWAHTVVPRLMAAGADLARVYRVDVTTSLGTDGALSLPADIPAMGRAVQEVEASLLVLDPLTSRLSANLDTHKDSETRLALEPLVAFADRYNVAVVGIMHFNKSGSTDPLALVMASKAFTAVARSVSTVIKDPDDDTEAARLFGTVKNNLGRSDLATLRFSIAGHRIETEDGDAWTGKLVWGADATGSIGDALERGQNGEDHSATSEAADWLSDYLETQGGAADSAEIKKAGQRAGHSNGALHRARKRLGLTTTTKGFPRRSEWATPDETPEKLQSFHIPRGDETNGMNGTNGELRPAVVPVVPVVPVVADGGQVETTGAQTWLSDQLTTCPVCGVAKFSAACPNCKAAAKGAANAN